MNCKGIYFIHLPSWGIYLGVPPKCGHTSVHVALEAAKIPYTHVRGEKVPTGTVVEFVVRHPLDRFKSAWRFFCVPGGDKYHGTGKALHGMSPHQFWKHTHKRPDNHWEPQVNLVEDLPERCDVRYMTLGDLRLTLPHVNATEGDVPMSRALERKILKYYAEDVALYERACE